MQWLILHQFVEMKKLTNPSCEAGPWNLAPEFCPWGIYVRLAHICSCGIGWWVPVPPLLCCQIRHQATKKCVRSRKSGSLGWCWSWSCSANCLRLRVAEVAVKIRRRSSGIVLGCNTLASSLWSGRWSVKGNIYLLSNCYRAAYAIVAEPLLLT